MKSNFTVSTPSAGSRASAGIESVPASPTTQEARYSSQHAIVIGGGLGGLSAAIHLVRQGWRVTLYEQNESCGGRMSAIQQDGFHIDMGPTLLMMPEVVEQLFAVCGRNIADYIELTRLDPAYRVHFADGESMDMHGNVKSMMADVARFAPEDAEQLPRLFEAMRKQYVNARTNFIEKPFVHFSSLLRPQTIGGLLEAMPLTDVYSFVARFVKDERLRQALTFQTLYLGISPTRCPSIYALLPYIEMEFGVWFPKGGMQSIARGLEKLVRELGVEVHTSTPVTKITTNNKRVSGVVIKDPVSNLDRHITADYVLANVDTPSAYSRLLADFTRKRHSDTRIAQREYGCSAYLLYLGVTRLPDNIRHHEVFLSADYKKTLTEITTTGVFPSDPAIYTCVPTRTDPTLAPPDHDVLYVLVPCPHLGSAINWETEAPVIREKVLDRLEQCGFPGLRQKIVMEQQFTPADFDTRYSCYLGSAFGLSPLFMQSSYFRPRMKSEELDGLYFAGAGTHPGGGVPIVLTSGRIAAECMQADYLKSARTAHAV